jgi:CubicO group peptidase (beta-lactamase class C family)
MLAARKVKSVKRSLILLAVLLLAGLAWLGWQSSRLLPIGAGYLAKALCSEYFVAGRHDPEAIFKDVGDIDPTFAWVSYRLDRAARRAIGYVGPGLAETTAVYRDGVGCTIATGIDADELEPLPQDLSGAVPASDPFSELPENPALERALDEAFTEPEEGSKRRTRAIVVLHHGRIAAERYAPGFDRGTPLIGWSMTKSITNNLVGFLVADGLLDPDAPAPVPEWQAAGDPRRDITLAHLLQMSSGLDFEEVYGAGSKTTDMLFASFSAAAVAADAPLAFAPGERWYYSSGTTNILARIVRDAVGGELQDVQRFTRERLLQPLGLSSMVIEADSSGAQVGSSFSYATARDWARLGQFWLQEGVWEGARLLPEGWMQWSTTPAPAAPHGEYGAQFWLNAGQNGENRPFSALPPNMFYASGFNGQSVSVFPDQEIVVVRLGFTTDDSWSSGEFLGRVLAALN